MSTRRRFTHPQGVSRIGSHGANAARRDPRRPKRGERIDLKTESSDVSTIPPDNIQGAKGVVCAGPEDLGAAPAAPHCHGGARVIHPRLAYRLVNERGRSEVNLPLLSSVPGQEDSPESCSTHPVRRFCPDRLGQVVTSHHPTIVAIVDWNRSAHGNIYLDQPLTLGEPSE